MKRVIIVFLSIQLGFLQFSSAQIDPHFSQYYAYPMWLNPALTGVINGDARVNGNFKNQWATINDAYKTFALSADIRSGERAGWGFNVIDQAAGGASYNYLAAYGSFSYAIPFSHSQIQWLSFGLQAGFVNNSIDASKLQFGNQYDPAVGYNPGLSSNEPFANLSSTVLDVNAGLFYHDDDLLKTTNIFGGISVAHLANSSAGGNNPENNSFPMRYVVHGGARIHANNFLDLVPHFIYVKQQENKIQALGISSEIRNQSYAGLVLGGMYRLQDAAVVNAGYHVNNLTVGASYDFNTSALTGATKSRGGMEISVSYIFQRGRYGRPICPSF